MKLVTEQISELRREEKKTKQSLSGYDDYLSSKEITSSDYSARAIVGDAVTDLQYGRERSHYSEIRTLLMESDYVTERSLDKIDIGTKFVIGYTDDEPQTVLLTECIYGLPYDRRFISVESPIGKAVIGKKANEKFQTEVVTGKMPSDRRIISGTIIEIKTDPKEYLHFIREKDAKNRMCSLAREERKNLLAAADEASKQEYQHRQEITESQKYLLLIEVQRLLKKAGTKSVKSRLAHIRKLLATAKVAAPPTDGTIGIGTSFDILVTDGNTSETRHCEMINHAVSDELEDEYVERIDTLGSKLYGLKQNDTIKYHKDGKTYKVAVINVDVNEHAKEDAKSTSYQYSKK